MTCESKDSVDHPTGDDQQVPNSSTQADADELAIVLQEGKARRSTWKRMYMVWTSLHYGISILAITATVLVGILPSSISFPNHAGLYAVLSTLAAVFVFLLAFTSPSKQAKAYIAAWRHLDRAIIRNESRAGASSADEIRAAIDFGEEILSGKDPF